MKKILKISAIVLAVLIVLSFIAKKILFDYSSVPDKSNITLTVNMLREAAEKGGPLPLRVNLLRIGSGEFLPGMTVSGNFAKKYSIDLVSYQVVYESDLPGGGSTVIIDAALDKNQLQKMKGDIKYDDAQYALLQKAMKNSAAIVATHEHFDHVGGIALSPFLRDIIGKTVFTEEQIANPLMIDAGFANDALTKCRKLKYEGMHVLFPGIVLVKTPGHTTGHQMVYVRLQGGSEYMIAGDIAWSMDNITELRQRPKIVSIFLGENRDQVGDELRWLHDEIYQKHKDIRLLVYHDQTRHDEYVKKGLLGGNFE